MAKELEFENGEVRDKKHREGRKTVTDDVEKK